MNSIIQQQPVPGFVGVHLVKTTQPFSYAKVESTQDKDYCPTAVATLTLDT